MTTEQEITELKTDMSEIKDKIADVYDILAQVNENIKMISIGLYGDEKNDHTGIIKKHKLLEDKITELERRITQIDKTNLEQDILLGAKKNIWSKILEYVKWAGLIYLVMKGVFGIDSLFGGKFI